MKNAGYQTKNTRRAVKRQRLMAQVPKQQRKVYEPMRVRDIVFDKWTGNVRARVI